MVTKRTHPTNVKGCYPPKNSLFELEARLEAQQAGTLVKGDEGTRSGHERTAGNGRAGSMTLGKAMRSWS